MTRALIGASSFPGFKPNANQALWGNRGINKAAWPDRKPLLGWYDQTLQATTDAMIREAVWGGLDYMMVNWYYDSAVKAPLADHVINNLLGSQVPGLQACVGFDSNTAETAVSKVDDWYDIIERWVGYFRNPRYLRVNGRPVVFIIKVDHFSTAVATAAGMTHKQLLDSARIRSGEDIYFVGCTLNLDYWIGQTRAAGYDCLSAYNLFCTWTKREDPTVAGPSAKNFAELAAAYRDEWKWVAGEPGSAREGMWKGGHLDGMEYCLPMSMGFHAGPWGEGVVEIPTAAAQGAHFLDAAPYLYDRCPIIKLALIDAWDEYGEGSILEPTYLLGRERLGIFRRSFPR